MTTTHSQMLVWGLLMAAATSTALARDCNGNGVEDIDDILNGDSQDCNANNIPDACEGWPIRFSPGSEWTLDRGPRDMAAGDLDNDGDMDLLLVQQSGLFASLAIFLNQGGRSFEEAPKVALTGEFGNLALIDFDGDTHEDVVLAAGGKIETLRNLGDGTFGSDTSYSTEHDTSYVCVADVNGDSLPDLLSVNRDTETIALRMNGHRGAGTFDEAMTLEIGGTDPVAIATGDLDADGDLDVVTANAKSGDFSVLLSAGDGSFLPPTTFPSGGNNLDALSFSVADFNGDGSLDLGMTQSTSNRFLFNHGDATFGEPVFVKSKSIFSGLRSLGSADFDHDGDLDIVTTSNREGVMVRQNDGSGGFAQLWELGFGSNGFIEVADFDSDGWADMALASESPEAMAFVWNDGAHTGGTSGIEIDVLPLEGCQEARGCRPHGGTLADLDGDGDLDAIGLVTHPGEFHIVDNEKGIMVAREAPYTFGRDGAQNGEHGQWVAPGDVDNDGDTDLVSIDNHSNDFWVHINRGDGTLEPVGSDRRIRVGGAPQHVILGDLDSDGDLDGVASNMGDGSISIVIGNGDGSFERTSTKIKTDSGTRGTAIGDLDGDGMNDIVAANSTARSLTILINRGDGTFPNTGSTIRLVGNPNGVTIADLDNDGDQDIAATVGNRQNCAILLNDGKSLFGNIQFAGPTYYPIDETGAYTVAAVDFNLDGVLDLITSNETAGSVSILLGNGDGSFGAPTSYSAGDGAGNRMALPGDLDGDGDLDIVTFNRGGLSATVFYNRSSLDTPDHAESICTVDEFFELASTTSSAGTDIQEFVKFILPSTDNAAIPNTLYQNSSRFRLHQEFLTNTFPEKFPALDAATYDTLVGRRDSRQYFVGAIRVIRTPKGATYGFDVFARFGDSKERLSAAEVKSIHDQLQESFQLGPLLYAPTSLEAVEVARDWQKGDPGFPILIEGSTGGFEPYTLGVGYGRVRLFTGEAFEEANASGGISFQDILILERAPRDIEGVVNGIITAERQGELSHVAVRTARRGTPNAFVRTALEDFADLEGELIRLQVTEAGYSVKKVTEQEAAAFWEANAGFLSRLPALDTEFADLPTLTEIAAMDRMDSDLPTEARFGGKATNLARLQSILTDTWSDYRINGFAVPMFYYLEFIRANKMPSAFDAEREVTYEAYLKELFASDEFATNSQFRFNTLATLREHMRDFGQVDETLVVALRDRIVEVMGTVPEERVRFRSSSNAEDAIEFNGAGLYDSTQGCVADDLDGDTEGPSRCNESKNGERDLARALKRVWSSLWNFRAFEERAFYRIPNELPAMGVLVSEAFDAELANGVATTGNATNRNDPRFVITAQVDDHSVVSPEPGILPEKNVLELSETGEVTNIIRAVASTLVEPGQFVLSDEELQELGELMWRIHTELPVDPGEHSRDEIVLEIEFKKRATGDLAVKQVRPFLLTERGPAPPTFALEIPAKTVLCAKFDAPNLSRTAIDEVELKSQLHLVGGRFELPAAIDQFSGSLIEKLVLGQDQRVATPKSPGTFTLEKLSGDEAGLLIYRFDYNQPLEFPNGETIDVKWAVLDFHTRDGVIVSQTLTLDEAYLIDQLSLQAQFTHGGESVTNFYGSCSLEPLQHWEIRAELNDGTQLVLEERFRNEAFGDFQPAALVGASIEMSGQHRTVSSYWDLIYKATRHNEHVEHLVILDPPVEAPGLAKLVHAIQLIAPTHDEHSISEGIYLDENLEEMARIDVKAYERLERNTAIPMPEIDVSVTPLEVDGTMNPFLVVTFLSNGPHYTVESSEDLSLWHDNVHRVSHIDHGDGTFSETWRTATSMTERSSQFLRVRDSL